jgi:hypothetical protein
VFSSVNLYLVVSVVGESHYQIERFINACSTTSLSVD